MLAESYQNYGDMAIKLRPGSDNDIERLLGKFSETWGSGQKGAEKGHGRIRGGGGAKARRGIRVMYKKCFNGFGGGMIEAHDPACATKRERTGQSMLRTRKSKDD